ncbi:MAG: isoprenylcysteine carboxylmethyltransferase family protein [Bacteroidota bacterium]
MDSIVASRIGLVVAVASMVTLVFRQSIFGVGAVAIGVQIAAAILMLWARLTFGGRSFHASADPTEGGLVTSGPYRYLRHPIYASIMYFLWAAALSHFSVLNTLLAVAATSGLLLRMYAEERLVVERYPEYSSYAARTKRIVPFVF